MPSKTMTASQIDRFVRSMVEQGVGVTRTTKGLFLRLPDGESTTVHFTNSDVRASDNLIARLRRAGVRHPEDPKDVRELPSNITDGPPVAARSIRKIEKVVEELGYPEVVTVKQITDNTEIVHITATRALYQMGFKPVRGKRNGRDWLVPQEILDRKPKEEPVESQTLPEREATAEEEAEILASIADPDFVEVQRPEAREFIDSVDSWVVDIRHLPPTMTIGDYFDTLRASGLDFEVRVWRK